MIDPGRYGSRDEIRRVLAQHEESHWWFRARRKVLSRLLERAVSQQQPLKSLDVGCSTGASLSMLEALGSGVGVDLDLRILQLCFQKGFRLLACSDVRKLPFKDNLFHLVTALDLIEHMPDDQGALQEMYRVLMPGGLAVISAPAFNWLWSSLDDAGHIRRYSAKNLRRVVEIAGFRIERISYANTLLFPLLLIQRVWGKLRRPHPLDYLGVSRLDPLLGWIFGLEAKIIPYFSFCYGGSLICLARKTSSTI
ncbi:MAG: class I SAM-dependent methyltransferase [Deltaproteobacteria bacterium]|nr:class I SAM-dependent methyltransferase [Deltaproteobacteria bacterium]MBW2307537.1 class I SAM-dependent methyltransferase [Deltaproteobacteria bacterium]